MLAPGEIALPRLPRGPDETAVFGDGRHPTTQLCAEVLDLLCRRQPAASVLDVGTGTGVLARIARARGSPRVVATDIDPQALQCARAHMALDHHPLDIPLSTDGPECLGERFDRVVANILEEPLRMLAPALHAALVPGGVALLSGFTRPQVPALRLVYERLGFGSDGETHREGWVLLRLRRG